MNNPHRSKFIPQRTRRHICRWCLLPLLLLALPAAVQAQFNYTTNNGTITITGYTGSGGDLVIPSTINGQPVTCIASNTFWYCTSLTSVTVPSSITSIGDAAFGWCTSLTNVTIANGLTSIRDQTFYTCTNLASITIPNSVTNIGDEAFYACTSLASLTIPSSVTSIGDGAFLYCWSLTSVTIPASVNSIAGYAFCGCFGLTGVYFLGNAPSADSTVFRNDNATVYYLPGTTGWGSTFGGLPTALWQLPGPGAWTLSATTISATSATLNGTVNPNGSLTAAWFQWGTTTDYGNLTAVIGMGSGTNVLPLSAPLAGLTPGVTYHYRVAATNSNGAGYSSDGSFTTLGPPQVWTLSATAVTGTNAVLNGTVNPKGYPTGAWFQWGTTTNYGNATTATGMGSGTSDLPLSVALAGLTLGATYHFRVAATNSYGTVYGSDQSFTTTTLPPPEVYTLSATAVTRTTATLNGTVNPKGYPTGAWFQWGTTTNYGNATTATGMGSGINTLPLSAPLSGLTPATTYHFRAAATNIAGAVYGSDLSFVSTVPSFSDADWVSLGSGMNDLVRALAVSGTNLYAGGCFTTAGGVPANYIAKWDGSTWSALGLGVGGPVCALAVSGTNLYAGGAFATAGGMPATNIARWDGSNWSPLGPGISNVWWGGLTVLAIAVSGTNLYAGGSFYEGQAVDCLFKWDGSNWSALGSGYINALTLSGPSLYVGGQFSPMGGRGYYYIAKGDGTWWSDLSSGLGGFYGSSPSVNALAVSGTNLYAGGTFATAGGVPANCIAKWDGNAWSALGSGVDGAVSELAMSGPNLYASGTFTTAGGVPANSIAK